MTMREKVSALHLVVLILISAAVVTTIALDGSEKKRETADTTECSVGMLEEKFDKIQWLANGGTYLLQPPINCSGNLVSLDACFQYNNATAITPNYFRMEVGVYKLNSSTMEYENRLLTAQLPLIQLISMPPENGERQGCMFNMTLNPLAVEVGDMIGVLVPNRCQGDVNGRIVCPLQPNFQGSPVTDGQCSVLYYMQLGTRQFPMSAAVSAPDCINLKATVVGNPSNSTQEAASEDKELSNDQIIGIAIGAATVVLIAVILIVSLLLYCKKYRNRQKTHVPSPRENGPTTQYQSVDGGQVFASSYEECNNGVRPNVMARGSGRDSRESSLRLTPSIESSYRQTFSNRAYSDANAYSTADESSMNQNGNSLDPQAQHSPPNELKGYQSQYEYASGDGEPYWVPASREGELRAQLLSLHIPEVARGEIEIYEELGNGNFGMVHRGLWTSSKHNFEVALKCLLTSSTEGERIKFFQEAAIMGQFIHPNILKILGMVTISEPLMILSEMMHKGDLHHYLKALRPSPETVTTVDLPALLLSFCRQVASGMTYLAHKSYVHRDVAARNILVSEDDMCKIADFGLSRDLQDNDVYISSGGKIPVKWTAPEALTYRKYSTASDVWSYGILLYEIWAMGTKPYQNISNRETLQKVLSGYRLPPPPGCRRSVYQLMLQCWHPEAASRPTFFDTLMALQRPDYQLLKWTLEDEAAYSEEARTIGSPIEAGQELYADMQHVYMS